MALFKILRGNRDHLPGTLTDGWAYFCSDTGEFFIDVGSTGDPNAKRVQVSDPNSASVQIVDWTVEESGES